MTDPQATLRGTLPERYALEDELGAGGMAVVYRAHDRKYDRPVAIKVLRPGLSAEGAERFLFEISVAARLQHPHILPLFDSGEAGGHLYYVMPLITGLSLRDRLVRETILPMDDALRIAADVARALDYAHGFGFVHRDIKPENILLAQGYALVADFGVARAIESAGLAHANEQGLAIGTPMYMSPEQACGDPAIDGRCDIYALGCVLYEVLTGGPPFTAPTPMAMIARHMSDPVPRVLVGRPGAPPSLDGILGRAMAKEAADRYQTGNAFAEAIDTARSGIATMGAMRLSASAAAAPVPPKAIAVLPFANLSRDADTEYFSDGLAEEILNALARVPGLRVAARTSSFSMKDEHLDIPEVGRRLGVGVVLEGSVRRAGNRLRVAARLVDAAGGYQRWSETFEKDLDDVFAVQDAITRAIVAALRLTLLVDQTNSGPVRPTNSLEAYELFLRARHAWAQRTAGALERAADLLREALALDPDFYDARATLAQTLVTQAVYGLHEPMALYDEARAAAERAVAGDPNLASAHSALGAVRALRDWDWPAAEASASEAINVAPSNATAYHWLAVECLAPQGRHAEAFAAMQRARDLDPLSPVIAASAVVQLYFARDFDAAEAAHTRALELDPHFGMAYFFLGQTLAARGRFGAAIAAFDQAGALGGWSAEIVAARGHALAGAGRREDAEAALADLTSRTGWVSPALNATVLVGLGRHDEALDALEAAAKARAADLIWIGVRPVFDPLRGEPRFTALLGQMGLTAR